MNDVVDALVLDLLEWVDITPRPYADVIEVWRTSCPRLPIWEDANDRGFIERRHEPGRGEVISVSASGLQYLRQHRLPQQYATPFPDSGSRLTTSSGRRQQAE